MRRLAKTAESIIKHYENRETLDLFSQKETDLRNIIVKETNAFLDKPLSALKQQEQKEKLAAEEKTARRELAALESQFYSRILFFKTSDTLQIQHQKEYTALAEECLQNASDDFAAGYTKK